MKTHPPILSVTTSISRQKKINKQYTKNIMKELTYWNHKGKYQELSKKLEKMIPLSGIVAMIYY